MQESIVIICLSLAFIYIMYAFYQKIQRKGGGCCGCDKGCVSSAAQKCPSPKMQEIKPVQLQDKK